jgi:hypothetical protein
MAEEILNIIKAEGLIKSCIRTEEELYKDIKKGNGQVAGLFWGKLDIHVWGFNNKGNSKHLLFELKTSKKKPSENNLSLTHLKQVALEKGLIEQNHDNIDMIKTYIIYGIIQVREISVFPFEIDFEQFNESFITEDLFEEIWLSIRNIALFIKDGDFPRNPGTLCGWCDYADLCFQNKLDGLKSKEKSYGSLIWELLYINGIGSDDEGRENVRQELGLSLGEFNSLLDGKLKIDEYLAEKLESMFGIAKKTWLEIDGLNRQLKIFNESAQEEYKEELFSRVID